MKHFFKMKSIIYVLFLGLGISSIGSCKDDENLAARHDPNRPVEIIDFNPKEGSSQTRLYIEGKNFGSDASQISVKIGGKEAKVVNVNAGYIYCLVPRGATEGTVEVAVAQKEKYTAATEKFTYIKKANVETLCGHVDEYGKSEAKDGSFDECGFAAPRWLVVDPLNEDLIYMVDGTSGDRIRVLDVTKRQVRTLMNKGQANLQQIRQISFTASGDTLLVANEQSDNQASAIAILQRKFNFGQPQNIGTANQNNACGTHPINGELYFNSRSSGELYRYDWDAGEAKTITTGLGSGSQYYIFFHPFGEFAYVCVPSKRIISKWEYNNTTKELQAHSTPFCGQTGVGGQGRSSYPDGNGTNAILGNPMQGVFVLNEQALEEGREDPYDFYFCDQYAHSIRCLSPDATVTTYAGRGSKGLNNDPNGYVDGDLLEAARFDQPQGMHYDSEHKIFYIAEYENKRIRMIRTEE